jgi:hypothetical protein
LTCSIDRGKAVVLQLFCNLSRVGLGRQAILVHQDDDARLVAESDPVRTRLAECVIGILGHRERIFVLEALCRAVAEHPA